MKKKIASILIVIIFIILIVPITSAIEEKTIKEDTIQTLSEIPSNISLYSINANGTGQYIKGRIVTSVEFNESDGLTEIRESNLNPLNPFKNIKTIFSFIYSLINPDSQKSDPDYSVKGKHRLYLFGFFGKIDKDENKVEIKGKAIYWFSENIE